MSPSRAVRIRYTSLQSTVQGKGGRGRQRGRRGEREEESEGGKRVGRGREKEERERKEGRKGDRGERGGEQCKMGTCEKYTKKLCEEVTLTENTLSLTIFRRH